ncbi:hypothetical protein ACFST9_17855 [Hymenobacter monticola]|uniref:Lipoprotein n=1 Tax=Hymenobacter monticola TaxID=1705399 RepID=A0ABY4AZ87_9BACT|nr:hypothetical protein [Hymenobacter monticola]UOE32228.1 hypothetical protein MTP16_13925 [Hymenobacter monticola]
MKAVYLFLAGLLASCGDIQTDCNGAYISRSVSSSQLFGLFLYELHPAANGPARVASLPDTLRVERCWVGRAAIIDCEHHGIAVVKGNTVTIKLAHPISNTMDVTLNGDYPLTLNRTWLTYDLGERQPPKLDFAIYVSADGQPLNRLNARKAGSWSFVK